MFHPSLSNRRSPRASHRPQVDLRRHERFARRLRHLHRLFQASLGVLACQHPAVIREVGSPVAWSGLYTRDEGGILLEGPRGRVAVVPTLGGAWAVGRDAPEVVRAVDEIVDVLFRTADNVLPSAKPGREGNAIARGIFYLQRALTEREFVRQYLSFVQAENPSRPLTGLFGDDLADL